MDSPEQDNAWTVGGRFYGNERDAWYAREDAKRAHESHVARVELGLFQMLTGQRFADEQQMLFSVTALLTTLGYQFDPAFSRVVADAVRLLYATGRYTAVATAA